MALKGTEDAKKALKTLMLSMNDKGLNSDQAINKFVDNLVSIMDELIRSGKVKFETGKVTGFCPQNADLQNGKAEDGAIE